MVVENVEMIKMH